LTLSPTFWTSAVNCFSGYENDCIAMHINILLSHTANQVSLSNLCI